MLKRRAKRRILHNEDAIKIDADNLTAFSDLGMGCHIPPLVEHVAIYFLQQNMLLSDVQEFYRHYENRQWKTITGKPQKNWKVLATDWIYNAVQQKNCWNGRKPNELPSLIPDYRIM
ncbi:hypothetical protein HK413_10220 [Mucilaginibacter sp. S1162]|uniref:Uncharacterized protein n=1 Tax=Mucilaginibacter humi TaxID=2732510 RepID=A0ABX1W745_9SPHI|nr:hypothetical protein [Mucilaginibacter humi]NNU34410.1 hypothetical protein [Mucilaginibacter humi]